MATLLKTNKSILKKIFLVEDDMDDQFFFTKAVGEIKNAHLLGIAKNGSEAIDMMENPDKLPDIIFMDNNMPVMGGIECLTRLKKNSLTKDIPVIMLTTDIGCAENARELGAKAFIKKPSNLKILHDKIEQMINLFALSPTLCV